MRMRWVSLHNHTTFSYGDGFGPVEVHVDRVVELGMSAVSVTEHGNNTSHAHLERECNKRGIKPIFGCEIYAAPTDFSDGANGAPIRTRKKFHQTILAADQEGYRNLNRLVSASWRDYFFQWPTTSAGLLRKYSKGLLVLSGCSDSLLSCTLLGGKELGEKRLEYTSKDLQNAIEVVERYQSIFGERYFIEVQRFPGLDRTCVLNPAFAEISKRTGAKLVATADVHYPYPEDNKMQRILHAATRGGTVESVDASWEYDILLTYPLSDQEITDDLIATGLSASDAADAVEETAIIAEMATVELPKNDPIQFPYPGSGLNGEDKTWSGHQKTKNRIKERYCFGGDQKENQKELKGVRYGSIEEYIWAKLREGWVFRSKANSGLGKRKQEYAARLEYEMEQISAKGFLHYFGMLSDAVVYAKDHKIAVGPARGSAAASLTCYLLRITEIDPMQFPHMLFARFIDPNRLDLPDVDLDFADDRRDEIRQYLISVYGADRVGNLGTFTRYRGKNSIDDVARVYRIPKWAAEKLKSLIVDRSGGDARQNNSLEDTFEMFEDARKILEEFPQFRLATELEGNYRGFGVHAAGWVISNAPIADTCAVYTRPKKGSEDVVSVIAADKKSAEYLGMLKADFLGLSTMGMIGTALDIIGMDLEDLYRVPITEERTLRAFKSNDLVGIFQFEGRATAIVNRDVSPDSFEHLADINALSRPGPLFSGMTGEYIEVKHGRKRMPKIHPVVDALTDWTYGQIVYQEQVLSIVKDLAGFPIERVGDIRRIISQKLGNMAMANALEEFIEGCWSTHQISPELARRIWDYIATSSTYSFNQSHSVSYALLGFWCMYLKQHHATAFYAAQLSKVGDGKEKLWKRGRLIQDAMRGQPDLGREQVLISPPLLEISGKRWSADLESHRVIAGFMQVHGIGDAIADRILQWREDQKILEDISLNEGLSYQKRRLEWADLQDVHGIGPKTIEKITEFVFSEDPFGLSRVGRVLDSIRYSLSKGIDGLEGLPTPTHHSTEVPQFGEHFVVWVGFARKINFKDVVEATRTRTGADEEEIMRTLKDPDLRKSCVIQAYDEGEEDVYLRVSRYQYPRLEAAVAGIVKDKDILLIAGKKFQRDFGISLHVKKMWVIDGSEE